MLLDSLTVVCKRVEDHQSSELAEYLEENFNIPGLVKSSYNITDSVLLGFDYRKHIFSTLNLKRMLTVKKVETLSVPLTFNLHLFHL